MNNKVDMLEDQMNKLLYYEEQLEFKKFIKKHFKVTYNFYFDSVYGVDGNTDQDIPNVICDASKTWKQNLIALNKHFQTVKN